MTHKITIIDQKVVSTEPGSIPAVHKEGGHFPYDELLRTGMDHKILEKSKTAPDQLNLFRKEFRDEHGRKLPLKAKEILRTDGRSPDSPERASGREPAKPANPELQATRTLAKVERIQSGIQTEAAQVKAHKSRDEQQNQPEVAPVGVRKDQPAPVPEELNTTHDEHTLAAALNAVRHSDPHQPQRVDLEPGHRTPVVAKPDAKVMELPQTEARRESHKPITRPDPKTVKDMKQMAVPEQDEVVRGKQFEAAEKRVDDPVPARSVKPVTVQDISAAVGTIKAADRAPVEQPRPSLLTQTPKDMTVVELKQEKADLQAVPTKPQSSDQETAPAKSVSGDQQKVPAKPASSDLRTVPAKPASSDHAVNRTHAPGPRIRESIDPQLHVKLSPQPLSQQRDLTQGKIVSAPRPRQEAAQLVQSPETREQPQSVRDERTMPTQVSTGFQIRNRSENALPNIPVPTPRESSEGKPVKPKFQAKPVLSFKGKPRTQAAGEQLKSSRIIPAPQSSERLPKMEMLQRNLSDQSKPISETALNQTTEKIDPLRTTVAAALHTNPVERGKSEPPKKQSRFQIPITRSAPIGEQPRANRLAGVPRGPQADPQRFDAQLPTAADQEKQDTSDILKQQLRDRIEVLRKAQESFNGTGEQTQNNSLHRGLSPRMGGGSGLIQPDNNFPHPRSNPALFARSFASELVERLREMKVQQTAAAGGKTSFVVQAGQLGELDIEFHKEAGKEQVTIFVENETARLDIQRVVPQIEENLNQKGYSFSGLEVEIRNTTKDGHFSSGKDSGQGSANRTRTGGIDPGLIEENRVNDNRKYGYNTMEVLA